MPRASFDSVPLRWIALTGAGFAVGVGAAIPLGEPIEKLLPDAFSATVIGMMVITVTSMCVAGGVLGASQWLGLRGALARPSRWIPLSAFGLGFGISVGTSIVEHVGELLAGHPVRFLKLDVPAQLAALVVVGAVTGVFLGTAQALLLDGSAARNRWITRSLLATVCAFPISLLVTETAFGRLNSLLAFGVFLALTGALIGAVTGAPVQRRAPAS